MGYGGCSGWYTPEEEYSKLSARYVGLLVLSVVRLEMRFVIGLTDWGYNNQFCFQRFSYFTLYLLLASVRGSSEWVKNPIDCHLAIGTEIGGCAGDAGKRKGLGREERNVEERRRRETVWDMIFFYSVNHLLPFYLHSRVLAGYWVCKMYWLLRC